MLLVQTETLLPSPSPFYKQLSQPVTTQESVCKGKILSVAFEILYQLIKIE